MAVELVGRMEKVIVVRSRSLGGKILETGLAPIIPMPYSIGSLHP